MNDSIPANPINRAGQLFGTSANVGFNHLVEKIKSMTTTSDCFDEDYFRENAEKIFGTADRLKGVPLKILQILSLDEQIVSKPTAESFTKTNHSTSPLSYSQVWASFMGSLERSPEDIFENFSKEAICAASIGQVHKAEFQGHEYAVKVKYPGIENTFDSDLLFLRPLLGFMGFPSNTAKQFTKEISNRLHEEADYQHELHRSVQISTACSGKIKNVNFPQYYPDTSSKDIITMDWVDGIPLDEFASSNATQELRDKIGQALWDVTFFQIYNLRLFHADPNPGNYIVNGDQLWVVDFGCTKELDDETFRKQFQPLRAGVLDSEDKLVSALRELTDDFDDDRYEMYATIGREVVEILSRPFRSKVFDFSDPSFIEDIFGIHETYSKDPLLRRGAGFCSSADSVFLTRTWLGLYRLLSQIGSRVNIELPDWMTKK